MTSDRSEVPRLNELPGEPGIQTSYTDEGRALEGVDRFDLVAVIAARGVDHICTLERR